MPPPELRPGKINCLRCGKKFDSRDRCTNRICPSCNRINEREYIPRIVSSKVYHGDGSSSISENSDS